MTTLLLPIRGFDGKTRLADSLGVPQRRSALEEMSRRAVKVGLETGLHVQVVTPSENVRRWAEEMGATAVDDGETGLNGACAAAVEWLAGEPWIVAHADLPLVTARALDRVVEGMESGSVLVPSKDGGTSIIARRGPFRFAYGPGSFHRHLAADPSAIVITIPELSVDLDSARDLTTLSSLGLAPTLVT